MKPFINGCGGSSSPAKKVAIAVTGVDLGLNHPAAQRLGADAFLADERGDGLLVRGVLGTVLEDKPDSSLTPTQQRILDDIRKPRTITH